MEKQWPSNLPYYACTWHIASNNAVKNNLQCVARMHVSVHDACMTMYVCTD